MKPKKVMTLSYIFNDNEVLLGMKKRGFGQGWWNGFGGKIHDNETIENGAIRELFEETGVRAISVQKHAILSFDCPDWDDAPEVHVFKVLEYEGEPRESDEMRPQWFSIDLIPYEAMWDSDRVWFSEIVKGNKFTGSFLFDENKKLVKHEINLTDLEI